MTSDVERIVAGLSEARREDIANADEHDVRCAHFGRLYYDDLTHRMVDAYPAHHDPDCTPDDDGGTRWSWTPIGLAVRAALQGRQEEVVAHTNEGHTSAPTTETQP